MLVPAFPKFRPLIGRPTLPKPLGHEFSTDPSITSLWLHAASGTSGAGSDKSWSVDAGGRGSRLRSRPTQWCKGAGPRVAAAAPILVVWVAAGAVGEL